MVDQEKIHNQCLSNDPKERIYALEQLTNFFSFIPDKQQAWNDLHRLTNDEDILVRNYAASALDYVFSHMPDKQQAWNDLHRLASDEDSDVRFRVAEALGSAFSHVPDKQQAWNDLHRLTYDEERYMRFSATFAFYSVFSHVPDKQQAWNDLHRLTNDEDELVRARATFALGYAFSYVPDKRQAWNDLIRLNNDEDHYVRTTSNYSLGRVSIIMASQAETEENYKKELEKAIEFFEIAAKESSSTNPSQFCLSFYRSFYTIIFKKQEAKEEVNKYLEEAKAAIKGSESKKQLFEAVQNLAEALKEVQNMENLDLQALKSELNFYRKYCDRAAEIMRCTEEKAPFATAVLSRGLPILERNLKAIIEEIQNKSKIACKESKGTEAEEIVCEIHNKIQNAIIDYQMQYLETTEILEDILSIVRMKIPQIPENKLILSKIEAVDSRIISADKYRDLPLIVSLMPTIKVVPAEQELDQIKHKIEYISGKSDLIYDNTIRIGARLDEISFSIFRIELNSHNVISNLDAMKIELEKLNEFARQNESILDKLNSIQTKQINDLNSDIQDRLDEIGSLIDDLPKNNNNLMKISDRLNELKQSDLDILLQRSSGITSLISFFVMFVQLYQQYTC